MPSLRISAYDPDGVQRNKSINTAHYTKDEIEEQTLQFKQWVHAGKPHREWKYVKSTIVPEKPVPPPVAKEPFERRHLSSLELPENKAMSFACIGSTRSGKSYAVCHIWEKIFKKHITVLLTHTGHGDIYKPFHKKAVITEGYNPDVIEEAMHINKLTKNCYDFCLIFDDLALDGKNSEQMTKLLTLGRNVGMSAIISGQKMTMLSATGRSNINYVLCFKQNTETAIEDTIKTYLRSYFPKGMKLSDMISLYKDMTADHNFFCVDTLQDKCFVSKI